MKAMTYHAHGAPEVEGVEEVERPRPKDDEVLIKVHAAVVTTADCAMRKGEPLFGRPSPA